ncbi:MAG: MTAP family purine nucleoside phosphorylase [Candidatus Altiarchaeota archaeon]|nr:MTAP family purine nucleoside phosphorylase [Candidatus Altiarchaeota archaeon]
MIAVVGGTGLSEADFFGDLKPTVVGNRYGKTYLLVDKEVIFLPRHGRDRKIPPHMINHKANIMALGDLGAEKIIGVGCSGSLKKEIKPGSILIPDDYLNPWGIESFFDDERKHITPGLDEFLRETMINAARKAGIDVIEKGVYAQTIGPRLETKAEIRFFKDYADVVGMTMASEATLAKELDIPYACICTVDNYAHGIREEELDFEEIMKDALRNTERIKKLLKTTIEELG